MENFTKEEMKDFLRQGKKFDFKVENAADHEYIKQRGFELKFHSDCSFTVKELPGISFSSYGDWGTFYTSWLNDKSKQIAFDMIDEGIIKFFRFR